MLLKINNRNKGFTMIELIVVVVIIGILATLALPMFIKYRKRGFDATSKADAKNAYTIAQVYFSSDPNNIMISDIDQLNTYGFKKSTDVEVTPNGTVETLTILVKHANSSTVYSVDSAGQISP